MNAIFLPMFGIGLMGVNRRLWDAGASYAHAQPTLAWQTHITYAAFALGVFQLPFLWNLSRTLRVQLPGLTPHRAVQLFGQTQHRAVQLSGLTAHRTSLGMWLFLASEAMFFGSLFSAYVMLRAGSVSETWAQFRVDPLEAALLIGASAAFAPQRFRLIAAHALALAFVVVKIMSMAVMLDAGSGPTSSIAMACWFVLNGVHAAHVLGGAIYTGWIAGPGYRMADEDRPRFLARVEMTRRYWLFIDLVWLAIVIGFL
jgi:heme/copper-type cytochrome/quinol oxidase subunit 3